MDVFSIFLIIFIGFFGISLLFSGISLLGYNSKITKVTGTVIDSTENNCMVLTSGMPLCNYEVTYDSPSGPVSKTIGIEKELKPGDKIDLYIFEETKQVSTDDLFIPWYYPWLLILLGILDFVFLYYIFKANQKPKFNNLTRENIEYIFGNDDIVLC